MDITGVYPIHVDCPRELYTLDGNKIQITGINTPGNCVHDALAKLPAGNVKEITFNIPDCTVSLVAHCIIDITTVANRAEKPSGNYTGSKDIGILGNFDVSLLIWDFKAANLIINLSGNGQEMNLECN